MSIFIRLSDLFQEEIEISISTDQAVSAILTNFRKNIEARAPPALLQSHMIAVLDLHTEMMELWKKRIAEEIAKIK